MARVALLASALLATLVAGCGGSGGTGGAAGPAASSPGPATIELTDGRLGGATEARPGSPLQELSPGGRS